MILFLFGADSEKDDSSLVWWRFRWDVNRCVVEIDAASEDPIEKKMKINSPLNFITCTQ